MAQFSTLEQMTNMSNTLLLNSAIGLIGQSVEWMDDKGAYNMGIVNSAMINSKGVIQVVVGDKAIDFDKVEVITNDGSSLATANALLGREITWYDAEGKQQTGIVDSISVVAGSPVLLVGKEVVDINTVVSVRTPSAAATP
jgi:flagellar hook assembly protein FlgD